MLYAVWKASLAKLPCSEHIMDAEYMLTNVCAMCIISAIASLLRPPGPFEFYPDYHLCPVGDGSRDETRTSSSRDFFDVRFDQSHSSLPAEAAASKYKYRCMCIKMF